MEIGYSAATTANNTASTDVIPESRLTFAVALSIRYEASLSSQQKKKELQMRPSTLHLMQQSESELLSGA
jgi:hypothetical protein